MKKLHAYTQTHLLFILTRVGTEYPVNAVYILD